MYEGMNVYQNLGKYREACTITGLLVPEWRHLMYISSVCLRAHVAAEILKSRLCLHETLNFKLLQIRVYKAWFRYVAHFPYYSVNTTCYRCS